MLPSGYLIRPCEGGGSIIHIVDHIDLDVRNTYSSNYVWNFHMSGTSLDSQLCYCIQVWSVPEVLRPLYESSKILAQKMTIAVSLINTS